MPGTARRSPAKARKPVAQLAVLTVTTLKRAGGSLIMTVPSRARDALGLTAGDALSVSVEGQKLILEPVSAPRPKYTLAQLLAEEKAAKIRPLKNLEGWTDAPPAGRETW